MELRIEDWAYLQKRIEEVADVGGELTLKFRNQTMIVKGGITEVREVPIEPVDKQAINSSLTIIRHGVRFTAWE